MIRDDFAIFIISYNRANNFYTLNTLKKSNYTGKYYILIGKDDPMKNEYLNLYNEHVVIFDKEKVKPFCDLYDCNGSDKIATYARNVVFKLAKKLKLKYFMVMDDDIKKLSYRICTKDNKLSEINMFNFNEVCEAYCDYLEDAKIAMLGCGNETSYFGGIKCFDSDCQRRCFNIFFRNVSIDFPWISAMNEDYISSIQNGKTGKIIFELKIIKLIAEVANKNNHGNIIGGMAEYYKKTTDYERSFYAVIANPSCSYVTLSQKNKMIITSKWNNAIPKIISDKYKK